MYASRGTSSTEGGEDQAGGSIGKERYQARHPISNNTAMASLPLLPPKEIIAAIDDVEALLTCTVYNNTHR